MTVIITITTVIEFIRPLYLREEMYVYFVRQEERKAKDNL